MSGDMSARCEPYRKSLKAEPFATIIPSRRPEVKYHQGLGRAKLAVAYATGEYQRDLGRYSPAVRGGEIYQRTADGWELLYRVESGTPADELPWRGESE